MKIWGKSPEEVVVGQDQKGTEVGASDYFVRRLTCLTQTSPRLDWPMTLHQGPFRCRPPGFLRPPRQTAGTQRSGQNLRQEESLPRPLCRARRSSTGSSPEKARSLGLASLPLARSRPSPGSPIAPPLHSASSLKGSSRLALQHGCWEFAGNGRGQGIAYDLHLGSWPVPSCKSCLHLDRAVRGPCYLGWRMGPISSNPGLQPA